ncbi:MAG: ABC transporter permease [Candidatus Dormibacteraeota bacterium]|nr:ABC transporter permease [Candidatus Dormibacteraeota bacterium]
MTVVEALRLALQGLRSNRLRSSLTMLGILIGVGAVILLVAFGNGTSVSIQRQIQSLGSNLIYIYPATQSVGGVSQGFGSGQSLTLGDVSALINSSQAPDIKAAIPITNAFGQIVYQNANYQAQVVGTSQDSAVVQNRQLAAGSFFTADDVTNSAKVAVIGQTVVDNLFGGDPNAALGKTIKVNRVALRVVGTVAPSGSSSLGNQDNLIAVPVTTVWNYLSGNRGKTISQIIVQATSAASINAAESEATQILLARHRITDPTAADFQMLSQTDILNAAGQITGILTALLGSIAAISLVVGGIGIMNIMLVTVTERTREIGIRKAIGARRRDVLLQFLIESMFLSGLGGVLGILLGAGLSAVVDRLATQVGGGQIPPPVVSVPSVVLAFGVSVGIGLFFGIYPANRAAVLNPIEALRYE